MQELHNERMTALMWLYNKLKTSTRKEIMKHLNDWLNEAKAMEKKQIIKTWYDCKLSIIDKKPMDAEEYYNDVYNPQNTLKRGK